MSDEPLEKKCPITFAWMKLDHVVARAAHGKIAEVGKSLDRQSVSDNADILVPLLEHFGILAQLKKIIKTLFSTYVANIKTKSIAFFRSPQAHALVSGS